MGRDTLFELSRRSVPFNKTEETKIIWRNSYLTVKSDKVLHFFNFSYNLECLDKNIDFIETRTDTPKQSPTTELFNAKFLKEELKSADMNELVLDSVLWPHNEQLRQEMTSIDTYDWSPRGFLHNQGVLAILNNIGGVELFVIQDYKWESIVDLSVYIKQFLVYNNNPTTFRELKESVYMLATSIIYWAPQINMDNSCYFVTVQKNNTILIWSILHDLTKICIKGQIENVSNSEITSIIWIPKSKNEFYLVCAYLIGEILAFKCHISNDEIKLSQCHTLWKYKDRMLPKHMNYTTIDNKTIFICSKHRHLLVQTLDENFKVVYEHLQNLNDYRITTIIHINNGFYVATVNCKMYKLNIKLTKDAMNVDLQLIEFKEPFPTHELHAISVSENNVMIALGLIDRRVLCRKETHKLDIVLMSTESHLETVIPRLIASDVLTHHWDCIELLRYKMIKFKVLPETDWNLINNAKDNINKLRLSLILGTIYNNLKITMRIAADANLQGLSIEKLKEKIFLNAAVSLMKKLHMQHQEEGNIDSFDNKSFIGARKYLEYYCRKYNKDMSIYYDLPMLNVSEWSDDYICQCCDKKLEGFTCTDAHLNVFCSQSFTLIPGDSYLVCRCCHYTVRLELIVRNPLCIFCGLYLINSYTPCC